MTKLDTKEDIVHYCKRRLNYYEDVQQGAKYGYEKSNSSADKSVVIYYNGMISAFEEIIGVLTGVEEEEC